MIILYVLLLLIHVVIVFIVCFSALYLYVVVCSYGRSAILNVGV